MDGRQSSRKLVGGLRMRTVLVLLLRTIGTSGMRYRFASLSNQPLKIACLVTMTFVFGALYTLTSSSSTTVMYPALANLAVLMRELVGMLGTMWSLALVGRCHGGGGTCCLLVFLFCWEVGKSWKSIFQSGCRLTLLCPSLCQHLHYCWLRQMVWSRQGLLV